MSGSKSNRISPLSNSKLHTQEETVLAILAQAAPTDEIRSFGFKILSSYSWADPEHQIVFECLAELRKLDADALREQLPAQMTRKGFPDIDVERYFVPHGLNQPVLHGLIRDLLKRLT